MLSEEYRPTNFADYVGQDETVRRVRACLDRVIAKGAGTALWVSGPSGAGKTTLARLCAAYVGAADIGIEELPGPDCDKAKVGELRRTLTLSPMVGTWKVLIVDEAHAMTDNAVQAWLPLLESLPSETLVIFTTTETTERELFGRFTGPFMRRCIKFALGDCVGAPVAARLKAIAANESIALTDWQAGEMVKRAGGNFGMAIASLEALDIPDPASQSKPRVSADVAATLARLGIAS